MNDAGHPQARTLMIVGLAEDSNTRSPNFACPSTRHIVVCSQEKPAITTAFCDDFGIAYILTVLEMVIMNNNAETSAPQFCG